MDGTIKGQTFSHCTAAPRAGVAQMARPFAPNRKQTTKTTDVHKRPDLFAWSGGGEGGYGDVGRWNHEWNESARMAQERADENIREIREIRGSLEATECDKRTDLFALHRGTTRRRGTKGQAFCIDPTPERQKARPFAPNRKQTAKTTDLHKRTGLFASANQHEWLRNRRIRSFVRFVDRRRRRMRTKGQTFSHRPGERTERGHSSPRPRATEGQTFCAQPKTNG
ncbi:MAG: hypothetical protein RLZZ179_3029 [Verrucomicrobiota bacterium]|jgi:hypothetical protein